MPDSSQGELGKELVEIHCAPVQAAGPGVHPAGGTSQWCAEHSCCRERPPPSSRRAEIAAWRERSSRSGPPQNAARPHLELPRWWRDATSLARRTPVAGAHLRVHSFAYWGWGLGANGGGDAGWNGVRGDGIGVALGRTEATVRRLSTTHIDFYVAKAILNGKYICSFSMNHYECSNC